jgi:hypothetical protein
MKLSCYLIFLVLFSYSLVSQIEINEVMYDPGQCKDSYCEWIELYNPSFYVDNQTINLSGCILDGKELNGEMEEYLLVVRNENNFTKYFGEQSNIIEAKISLKNSGEKIVLEGNGNCSDSFDYATYIKLADGNNKTLEKNKDDEWKESIFLGGTPGTKNSVFEFSYDYSPLKITEVLPDPFGKDDNPKPEGECIELFNSGDEVIYLDGLVLYDSEDDHELYITESNTNSLELCSECYTTVYRDEDSDFDLSKINDKVRLFTGYPLNENVLIDQVSFSNAVEGTSFSHFEDGWFKTVPTMGSKNVYTLGCDWGLVLEMDNSIFQGNDLDFKVIAERYYGEKENLTVRGKIEDVFGSLIKTYSPWTNKETTTTASKSYSPNLAEGIYQVSFWFEDLKCPDQDQTNNLVTKLIAINPQYKQNQSSLNIERSYLGSDEEAEWGDQFTVKVNIYKGDESRYSVQLWAEKDGEKVSKTTKVSLHDPFKNYPLTLPLQLEPNCNNKISDGRATLVLEAFDLRVEQEFDIKDVDDQICKDYLDYIKDEEKKINKNSFFTIVNLSDSVNSGDVVKLTLQLINEDQPHQYQVWSYIYRGSKCYSCLDGSLGKESNLQVVSMKDNEVQLIDFLLKVDPDIDEGEYKVKIKVKKDQQKTNKEITKPIYIKEKEEILQSTIDQGQQFSTNEDSEIILTTGISDAKKKIIDKIKGVIVYESSSEKAKNLLPYLLIITFGLLCVILMFKK